MTPITRETARASAESAADLFDIDCGSSYEMALEQFATSLNAALVELEERHASFCTPSSLRKATKSLRQSSLRSV